MNQQSRLSNQTPVQSKLTEALGEHPIVEWVSENGRTILYLFLGAIFVALLFYRLYSRSSLQTEGDYFRAEQAYAAMEKQSPANAESLRQSIEQLTAIVARHPELQAKYDGPIGQYLINQGKINEALPYASFAINQTLIENRPFFSDFSTITLLIEQNKTAEALESSFALQQLLEKSEQDLPILLTYNLFRIGMLQQSLGDAAGEKKAWDQWKSKISQLSESKEGQVLQPIFAAFQDGKVSLMNYVEARQKKISEKNK